MTLAPFLAVISADEELRSILRSLDESNNFLYGLTCSGFSGLRGRDLFLLVGGPFFGERVTFELTTSIEFLSALISSNFCWIDSRWLKKSYQGFSILSRSLK